MGIDLVDAGLDMVANLEKIGDHLANIAERLDVCDVGGVESPECQVDRLG